MSDFAAVLDFVNSQQDLYTTIQVSNKDMVFVTNTPFSLERILTLMVSEPETIAWLNSMNESDILWDVGANVGIFTIYAAVQREVTVFSFEPESNNYALLNRNIQANNVNERVKAVCCGLSDVTSLVNLYKYCDFESSGINSVGQEIDAHLKPRKSLASQAVMAYKGTDIHDLLHIPYPTHIKIDVDGIEHLIINGLADFLKHGCKSILVELNFGIEEHRNAAELLRSFGFVYNSQLTDDTQIKDGYWKGMVNMIFVRDHALADVIYNNYREYVDNSKAHSEYRECLKNNSSSRYVDSERNFQFRTVKRK